MGRLAFLSTKDGAATLMFSPPPVLQKLETDCQCQMQTLLLAMRVTSVVLVGVYIPYQANARTAINNLIASD